MVRTRVGYAGGTLPNPTYENLGDHTESIQIDYDPEQITYTRLLEIFWKSHNPCHRAGSRQYLSAVFHENEKQKQLALESKTRQEVTKGKIHTQVLLLKSFTPAEDYHQKYRLRQNRDLMNELRSLYPNDRDLVASTAAARLNGYLGGHGSLESLETDLNLPPEKRKRILQILQ